MLLGYPVMAWFHYNPVEFGDEIEELAEQYGFEAIIQSSIDPMILAQQAIVVVIIGTILSTYSWFKLLRLNPINAMRK
jgi:hypothetical protein